MKGVLIILLKILLTTIIMLWLLLSVLLNHAEHLGLDKHAVHSPWLVNFYQQKQLKLEQGFILSNAVISEVNHLLFVDDQPIMTLQRPLIGAIEMEHIFLAVTDDSLILISKERTELLEQLGAGAGIPAQIQNIGLHYNAPILQTRSGMWRGNFMLDNWERVTLDGVAWSYAEPLPALTEMALKNYLNSEGVAVVRLMRDLHNGRILKDYGIWIMDIFLLLLLVLLYRGIFGSTSKSV
jgi:hypothetical protein